MQLLNRFNNDFTFLFLIFLVALTIRLVGIDYGLPFNNFQPDEPKMILPATHVAVGFVNTKDFSKLEQPEYKYPHAVMNIFSFTFVLIYYVTRVVDKVYNIFPNIFTTFDNSTFTLFARVTTAFFGSLLCLIVFLLGKEIKLNRFVCFGWALLVAVNLGLSVDSKYATRDMVSIFLSYLGLYFLFRFVNYKKVLYLIVGSFFIGFSIVSSLERVFFILPIVLSVLFVTKKNLFSFFKLGLVAFFSVCLGMFLTSPYIFINFDRFMENGLGGQQETQSFGQIGRTALNPFYLFVNNNYVDFDQKVSNSIAGNLTTFVFILSVFAIFFKLIKKRDKYDLILLSILIAQVIVFSRYRSQMIRWYIGLLPIFLYYFSYVFLTFKFKFKYLFTTIFIIGLLSNLFYSLEFSYSKTLEDTRSIANKWTIANLEQNSLIYNSYWSTDGDFENIKIPFYYYEIKHNMKNVLAPNLNLFYCYNTEFQNQYTFVSSYVTNIYNYPESLKYYPTHSRSFLEFYDFINKNFELVKVIEGDKLFSNPGPTIKIYKVIPSRLNCENKV